MQGGAGVLGLLQRYVFSRASEVEAHGPFFGVPHALRHYDDVSFERFLVESGASPGAIEILRLGYLDLWGEGMGSVSALMLIRDLLMNVSPPHMSLHQAEEASREDPHPGERTDALAYGIAGGNDLLPRAFARSLGHRVKLGRPVERIEHDERRVVVTARGPDGVERFEGDRAICALPFALLREVEVRPPFSAGKRRAVEGLSNTAVCRVYVPTARKTWRPPRPLAGERILPIDMANTDSPAQWVHDASTIQPGPGAVIASYMTSERAYRASALAEDERVEATARQLQEIYPGLGGAVAGGVSKCWTTDPWARGGYCWFRPGQMQAFTPHMRVAEGNVHFAGDHTSSAPGWMEGAIESGLRAAAEVDGAA